MSRFIEVFRINDNTTVEVNPYWEVRCQKQQISMFKRRLLKPLKRFSQWGLGSFIKGQVGSLLGTLGAYAFPAMAISGALLIASLFLYFSIQHPDLTTGAPVILGMALGVIAHV
jgi:hypothetical protein